MSKKNYDKETQNALAVEAGEPLPYPELNLDRKVTHEEKKKRLYMNDLARANGVPIPWPEEEWTWEDEEMVKGAVKKFTKNYRSLPRGYDREDMIQECRVKWSKVREKHIEGKSKKNTYCFNVTQNHIRDLVRAGNTDKRMIEQKTLEFNEDVTGSAIFKSETFKPGNKKITNTPQIEYDGDNKIFYDPVARGTSQNVKLRTEREPELWEIPDKYRETGERDLTPYNALKVGKTGDDEDIILK